MKIFENFTLGWVITKDQSERRIRGRGVWVIKKDQSERRTRGNGMMPCAGTFLQVLTNQNQKRRAVAADALRGRLK